ncbi:MAG: DNA repair protein RecN [Treponema sp.]|nr:DNA repair protein RecN [Treponema sp.]
MLEELSIKDFALIDNANVEFNKGFTVLSGETGAGKSLLIGALTFLLGGKAGVDQIRAGANESVVSGSFYIGKNPLPSDFSPADDYEPENAWEWLFVHGIEVENNRVLLRRYVRQNGKTGAWIDGTAVTRADLAQFSSFLIDIHGQHEHQSLMKVGEHRKYLDSYAGLTDRVKSFTSLFSSLVEKRKILSELNSNDKNREQTIELLNFSIKEISDAKLKAGEDAELDDEEKRLSSFEKLYSDIDAVNSAFDGGNGDAGIISVLKRVRAELGHAVALDKSLEKLDQRLESAFYEINDISDEFKKYSSNLVFDPERLAQVQERQTLIYNLKKKYASSVNAPVSEVIEYAEKAQKKLEQFDTAVESKDALVSEIKSLEKQVYVEAKAISSERKKAAEKMSEGVLSVLSSLGMSGTRFAVSIAEKAESSSESGVLQMCGPYGMDNVEFLISANPGQPLAPLAKIASGGELSRVMLSLKTILAQSDSVGTMIFDEIDTGIGGEIAVSIGSHLKKLAKDRQVLCITHLASIAVYADNQLKIEKSVSNGSTHTQVYPVDGEARVSEIARMLSGDAASSESLEHARSLLAKYSA